MPKRSINPRARYFFIGGGAYTHPRAVRALAPQASVTVAEIDPHVTRTTMERMFVSPEGMRILHMDARVALQRLEDERFDVIISATDAGEPPKTFSAQRGFERTWQQVTAHLLANGTPLEEVRVLTDDYVPVERLVARLLVTELGC